MTTLAILGASGHGRVVADIALCCNWDVCFFDDVPPCRSNLLGLPYGGTFDDLVAQIDQFTGAFVAIGDNEVRMAKHLALIESGFFVPTLVHTAATVSQFARLGGGSVIMPGAIINAGADVGDACIVNTGASVDHDCRLSDGVHISPGAHLAGEVSVGRGTWIGIGAVIRQQVQVGSGSMVAAGATVVKNVENNTTVAGVAATIMR